METDSKVFSESKWIADKKASGKWVGGDPDPKLSKFYSPDYAAKQAANSKVVTPR